MNSEPTGPLRPSTTEIVGVTEKRSGGLAASGELVPVSEGIIRYSAVPIEVMDSIEKFYDLGRTIGRGEFAKVKLARCRVTQQLVAIKIIRLDVRGDRLYREISILAKLTHPHIIKLLRVLKLPDRMAMVMEYASGGEVFDYVQAKGHLSQIEVRSFMCQILQAVGYLHNMGIVHRDLKLENLLRRDDGSLAITDFGFATSLSQGTGEESHLLQTACGSPCYAAPELVLDKKGYRGLPADLWSCGVIMYAMAYGFLPFESDLQLGHSTSSVVWTPSNVYQLYQHIANNPLRLPRAPSDGLDALGQDLLLRLLEASPERRITMEEVWQHPWMSPTVP